MNDAMKQNVREALKPMRRIRMAYLNAQMPDTLSALTLPENITGLVYDTNGKALLSLEDATWAYDNETRGNADLSAEEQIVFRLMCKVWTAYLNNNLPDAKCIVEEDGLPVISTEDVSKVVLVKNKNDVPLLTLKDIQAAFMVQKTMEEQA